MSEQLIAELKSVKAEILGGITEHKTWTEGELRRIALRVDGLELELRRPEAGGGFSRGSEVKSLADLIYQSDDFKNWTRSKKGRIVFPLDGPIFQEYHPILEAKTTITSGAVGSSTPGILVPARVPGIVKPGVRSLRVRDLLPNFPTSNNAVEYIKESTFSNAASPAVEANAKQESALTFTISSAPVRLIAHWIPASRQVIDDFRELGSYLNVRLIDGLRDKEDTELLNGDNLGDHLHGLTLQADAYDTARNVAGDTRLDKLNHAVSQLEDANFEADGIILNPRDWRAIQLLKTEEGGANTGTYLIGSPSSDALPSLWGKPVATTTAMTVGKFLVGAFRRGCAVWDRMDSTIDISDSHSDYFVKNLLAIRAEQRLALTVYRSDTLVYGAF